MNFEEFVFENLNQAAEKAHFAGKKYFGGEFFAGQAVDLWLLTPVDARLLNAGFHGDTHSEQPEIYKLGQRLADKWRG